MTNRRTYTAEFKRDAVRLAQSTENITSAARDLGTLLFALRKWIKAAQNVGEQAFPGQGRPALTTEQQGLKRLRKENKILRQEREILETNVPDVVDDCGRGGLRFRPPLPPVCRTAS